MTTPPHPRPTPGPEPWPVPPADELDLAASELVDRVAPTSQGGHAESPTGGRAEVAHPDRSQPERNGASAVEARAAKLRPVVDALGESIQQPDTSVRDAQIRQALAVRGAAQAASAPADDGVRQIRPSRPLARRWLAVAAALLVLVAGGWVVAHLAGSSTTTRSASIAGPANGSTTSVPRAAYAAPATGAADLPDLGAASDGADLVARVRQHQASSAERAASAPTSTVVPTPSAPSAASGEPQAAIVTACTGGVRATHPELGPIDLVARATVGGQAVDVLVFAAASPAEPARVVAVRPTDCRVVVDQPL